MYNGTGKETPANKEWGGQHPCYLDTYNLSGGGIWKIHRPHNERQNVTAKDNTALTLRGQGTIIARLHEKRKRLGQALKKKWHFDRHRCAEAADQRSTQERLFQMQQNE